MKRGQSEPPEDPGRAGARAYAGALEAVLSVLIGAGLGYLADGQLDTSPWGLLVGLMVGFGAFVLRIVRLRDELMAPPNDRRDP